MVQFDESVAISKDSSETFLGCFIILFPLESDQEEKAKIFFLSSFELGDIIKRLKEFVEKFKVQAQVQHIFGVCGVRLKE